ncbi:MAG: HAD-IA family hydrolase [Acidobacteria bacterium]|jgi:putative hydrolase of the HAD superfamily|nr:HAD-IA family hydrolase [Acidobacteriota bacterium]
MKEISHLFFDLGGVCLTNAWDHISREAAAELFRYDFQASEERHKIIVEKFEIGEASIKDYLNEAIFFRERDFSEKQFIEFMESQSKAHPRSLEILEKLRSQNKYEISVLNNESLELNLFRIEKFGLRNYFTNFYSSCFLGVAKPNSEIYRKVLQITQTPASQCLLIDDRQPNVEAAAECGFQILHLPNVDELEKKLAEMKII